MTKNSAKLKSFKQRAKALLRKRSVQFGLIPALCLLVAFGASYGVGVALQRQQRPAASQCDGTCVALNGNAATPSSVSVAVGDYVQFNTADGGKHNLSLGRSEEDKPDSSRSEETGGLAGAIESAHEGHATSGAFVSGDFGEGEAWRVQFKKEGTYYFKDKYNPELSVLVVTYTPGRDYKVN